MPDAPIIPLYMGLACLADPMLCPMDGRCPRCTASFQYMRAKGLQTTVTSAQQTMSEAELGVRLVLRALLASDDPDFDLCRQLQAVHKVLSA